MGEAAGACVRAAWRPTTAASAGRARCVRVAQAHPPARGGGRREGLSKRSSACHRDSRTECFPVRRPSSASVGRGCGLRPAPHPAPGAVLRPCRPQSGPLRPCPPLLSSPLGRALCVVPHGRPSRWHPRHRQVPHRGWLGTSWRSHMFIAVSAYLPNRNARPRGLGPGPGPGSPRTDRPPAGWLHSPCPGGHPRGRVPKVTCAAASLPLEEEACSLIPLPFETGLCRPGLLRHDRLWDASRFLRPRRREVWGTPGARGPGAEGRGAGQAAAERQASDVVLEREDVAGRPRGGWGGVGHVRPGAVLWEASSRGGVRSGVSRGSVQWVFIPDCSLSRSPREF